MIKPCTAVCGRLLAVFLFVLFPMAVHAATADEDSACVATEPVEAVTPMLTTDFPSLDAAKPAYKQTDYWHRHNTLKGWAWGTLGFGLTCGLGALIWGSHNSNHDEMDYGVVGWIMLCSVGGSSLIASVPLFILAHTNKVKAKRSVGLSLNVSSAPLTLPDGHRQSQPGLGLCLNF